MRLDKTTAEQIVIVHRGETEQLMRWNAASRPECEVEEKNVYIVPDDHHDRDLWESVSPDEGKLDSEDTAAFKPEFNWWEEHCFFEGVDSWDMPSGPEPYEDGLDYEFGEL